MDLSSAGAQRILSLLLDVSMRIAAFLFRRSLFTPVIKAVSFIKAEDTGASCPQAALAVNVREASFSPLGYQRSAGASRVAAGPVLCQETFHWLSGRL